MIYAKLDTPWTYMPLVGHPLWEQALASLRSLDENSPLGIQKLRGDEMYLNVHTYDTKPESECRYEGHLDMIDIQYVIKGGEFIDWAFKGELTADGAYDLSSDFQFYLPPAGSQTRLHLRRGHFCVFFPDDAHCPQIYDGAHPGVFKAVVKIHRSLLK